EARVGPRQALALAMGLNELATNALKYGALSEPGGKTRIVWSVDGTATPATLRLRWEEAGGPPVRPPQRRGFGSRLIEEVLAKDMGGDVQLHFLEAGVVCTIEAPL
ncbi:MAG TPA: sensor histidine kinase, partial [Propylenella sp.]|nr:sensor histidine kinase [Propylenella sp.]